MIAAASTDAPAPGEPDSTGISTPNADQFIGPRAAPGTSSERTAASVSAISSTTPAETSVPAAAAAREVATAATADSAADDDFSLSALIQRHDVSHLQCTPSMVRMLLANDDTRAALGRIRHLMVGGEAMTDALETEVYRTAAREMAAPERAAPDRSASPAGRAR